MKLVISKPRGFCAGVERAIDTVKAGLGKWGAPLYVKHEIVHNRHVVQELKELGAIFIEDLSEVPEGSRLVFSAHGVTPQVREEAEKRQLQVIDATCGLVTKVHSAAKRFASKGYYILLIGHRKHVEIIGTKGEAPEVTTVVESVEEVKELNFPPEQKLAYLTQTTLSLDDVEEIVQALRAKFPQLETLPSSSICYATQNRQMALRHITNDVDLVLVVGDKTSSNSNRLREVAEKKGIAAYLIQEASEIQISWLRGVQKIAMTAGASTPEKIVQECVRRLETLGVQSIEEVPFVEENVFFELPREVRSGRFASV